jgi:hypothetical protein
MMRLRFPHFVAMFVVVAGAFAVSPGCASSPDAGSTVHSMGEFGLEVAKVKDSIDRTVASLETVVASQPADIVTNVEAYGKTVKSLDGQAKVVRGRAEEMKAKGDEFFKEWEAPANVTPERRAELTQSYGKIKTDMAAAKEEFTPFLAALKDIESYLKVDPSVKGIGSMSKLAAKAKESGATVKARIDAVLVQVNSVRGMLQVK